MPYNDKLEPEEQIATEEDIAAYIFHRVRAEITEEGAAQLGRDLLHLVLSRFRGDLMDDPKRCRYTDCTKQHPLAFESDVKAETVTCEECRKFMGLDPLEDCT